LEDREEGPDDEECGEEMKETFQGREYSRRRYQANEVKHTYQHQHTAGQEKTDAHHQQSGGSFIAASAPVSNSYSHDQLDGKQDHQMVDQGARLGGD
jgi:hypothetical protein